MRWPSHRRGRAVAQPQGPASRQARALPALPRGAVRVKGEARVCASPGALVWCVRSLGNRVRLPAPRAVLLGAPIRRGAVASASAVARAALAVGLPPRRGRLHSAPSSGVVSVPHWNGSHAPRCCELQTPVCTPKCCLPARGSQPLRGCIRCVRGHPPRALPSLAALLSLRPRNSSEGSVHACRSRSRRHHGPSQLQQPG